MRRVLGDGVFKGILWLLPVLAASGVASAAGQDDGLRERVERLEKAVTDLTASLEAAIGRQTQRPPAVERMEPVEIDFDGIRYMGSPRAGLVLVEYADFECPYCARSARETFPELKKRFVDAGAVRYIFRHMPLEQTHPMALRFAVASECGGEQNRFWDMRHAMFARAPMESHADVTEAARAAGLDLSRFDTCLKASNHVQMIRDGLAEARRLGVRATPSFLLGRVVAGNTVRLEMRITGSQPLSVLEDAIVAMQGPRSAE